MEENKEITIERSYKRTETERVVWSVKGTEKELADTIRANASDKDLIDHYFYGLGISAFQAKKKTDAEVFDILDALGFDATTGTEDETKRAEEAKLRKEVSGMDAATLAKLIALAKQQAQAQS